MNIFSRSAFWGVVALLHTFFFSASALRADGIYAVIGTNYGYHEHGGYYGHGYARGHYDGGFYRPHRPYIRHGGRFYGRGYGYYGHPDYGYYGYGHPSYHGYGYSYSYSYSLSGDSLLGALAGGLIGGLIGSEMGGDGSVAAGAFVGSVVGVEAMTGKRKRQAYPGGHTINDPYIYIPPAARDGITNNDITNNDTDAKNAPLTEPKSKQDLAQRLCLSYRKRQGRFQCIKWSAPDYHYQ